MSIYRIAESKLEELRETTFPAENLQERQELQRLIKAGITIFGADRVQAQALGDHQFFT